MIKMKIAKLFQNGQSQAVRLPKEFRFEGQEVFIRKVWNMTVLIPTDDPWSCFLKSIEQFSDDFMKERIEPTQQARKVLFE